MLIEQIKLQIITVSISPQRNLRGHYLLLLGLQVKVLKQALEIFLFITHYVNGKIAQTQTVLI